MTKIEELPSVPQTPPTIPPPPQQPAPAAPQAPVQNDTGISTIELKELTDYLNLAIERKVFTKEEIIKVFPIWEKVSTFCDRIERKIKVENLYKEASASSEPEKVSAE